MTTTDLRPPPERHRMPTPAPSPPPRAGGRRRRGTQSAGRILLTIVAALGLAALVNADAMVERAERKPLGPDRDRSLAIWHPVQDVAHITQLSRLRDLGDWIAGNEDRGASAPGASSTSGADDAAELDRAERPVLRLPQPGAPLRVHLAGDSIMHDAGNAFLQTASGSPLFASTLHYENATGLARPDFYDWRSALARDMADHDPEVVFLLFGGNDGQGIETEAGQVLSDPSVPGWREEYAVRVGAVMDAVRADGRLVFWIGLPPMRDGTFDAHARTMSAVYREQAERRPWVTFVDTVPMFADAQGRYSQQVPDADGTMVDVRKADGVHLNTAGADRLARHLLDLIQAELDAG